MGGRGFVTRSDSNRGLPARTQVMLPGLNWEIKIGTAVFGSHPRNVEAHPGRGFGKRLEVRIVLHEVDDGLPLAGRAAGVWRVTKPDGNGGVS